MRHLALEGGEEESGENQQTCGKKNLPGASEDPSSGDLNPDPTDSKTLQGTALGVGGPPPLSVGG